MDLNTKIKKGGMKINDSRPEKSKMSSSDKRKAGICLPYPLGWLLISGLASYSCPWPSQEAEEKGGAVLSYPETVWSCDAPFAIVRGKPFQERSTEESRAETGSEKII